MSIKLDLSQFKHVKSDKNSTTLQHVKGGHTLTLAHNSLAPASKAQLSALSKIAENDRTDIQSDANRHQSNTKMAEGGQPQKDRTAGAAAGTVKGASGASISDPKSWWAEGGAPKEAKFCEYCGDFRHEGACEQLAEGGKIPQMSSQDRQPGSTLNYKDLKKEYINKNKPKFGEHNKPHYDEGTGDVQAPPDMAQQAMQGVPDLSDPAPIGVPPAPEMAQVDPEVQAKREIYNNLVAPIGGKFGRVHSEKAFNGDMAPKDWDNQAWDKAEKIRQADLADQKLMENKTKQDAEQTAINQQKAGLTPPPVLAPAPMPQQTAPAPADPNASGAQPGQPQQAPQQHSGVDLSNPQQTFQQGVNQQMAGIQAGAQAQGELGQAQAEGLQKNIEIQQANQDRFNQSFQSLEQERQAHMEDIKQGHIDPERYWTGDKDGNGSHSKLMTGIGMILAGFNPTNSPNAAINFLKFNMEQNLKSQEKNLDAKNNLLAANLKQFGNMRDATEMTRLMQHDIVANELQKAAAKAQSPLAKAAAMQASGKLLQDAAPQAMTFAMRQSFMNLNKDNSIGGSDKEAAMDSSIAQARMFAPELAKEMQAVRVPGYDNFASRPVPNEAMDQLRKHRVMDIQGRKLLDFSMKHSGSLDLKNSKVGQTMAHEMSAYLNDSLGLGAMTEDRHKFLQDQLMSDPTKFFNEMRGSNSQLREVLHSNQMRKSEVENQYKLHPSQAPQPVPGEQAQHQFKEGQTATQKSTGKPIVFKNGAWRLQ